MTTWQERADALCKPDTVWALEEALRRTSRDIPTSFVREYYYNYVSTIALAEMIAKHEPAPACPKLAAAREACVEHWANPLNDEGYRQGKYDDEAMVRIALSAMDIHQENINDPR